MMCFFNVETTLGYDETVTGAVSMVVYPLAAIVKPVCFTDAFVRLFVLKDAWIGAGSSVFSKKIM